MDVRVLTQADLPRAADIHAASFENAWDKNALADYLSPQNISLGLFSRDVLQGFILLGACTDQTDIITIAVSPAAREAGLGQALVAAAEADALARGVEIIFLEVAEDNAAAIGLYKACGYNPIGTRKNYYKRAGGRVTALTMRKNLGVKTLSPSKTRT